MAQRLTVHYTNGNRRSWVLRDSTRIGSAAEGVLLAHTVRGEVRIPYRNVEAVEISRD